MLIPMHVAIVVIIKDPVEFANVRTFSTILLRSCAVSNTPPKVKAQTTSQIVFNILAMPPRVSKSSTIGTPLSRTKPECNAVHTPESIVSEFESSGSFTKVETTLGCNMIENNPANKAPIKIVGKAGIFL